MDPMGYIYILYKLYIYIYIECISSQWNSCLVTRRVIVRRNFVCSEHIRHVRWASLIYLLTNVFMCCKKMDGYSNDDEADLADKTRLVIHCKREQRNTGATRIERSPDMLLHVWYIVYHRMGRFFCSFEPFWASTRVHTFQDTVTSPPKGTVGKASSFLAVTWVIGIRQQKLRLFSLCVCSLRSSQTSIYAYIMYIIYIQYFF